MRSPLSFLSPAIRKLGRSGQGLFLLILLSLILIFVLHVFGSGQPGGDRTAPVTASRPPVRHGDATRPPLASAAAEAQKADPPELPPISGRAPKNDVTASSAAPQRCPFAEPGRRLVTVREEVAARTAPSATSKTVQDKDGADRAFDPRVDLEILESRSGWLRLRQKPLRWPPKQASFDGWAPEGVVRPINRTLETMTADEKVCLFVDPASWRDVPAPLQKKIRDVALRILRQDERCRLIGDGGMMGESQRFYLTCYPSDGGQPYHYWLSASSIEKDFSTPAPVEDGEAMDLCRKKLERLMMGKGLQNASAPDVKAGAISSFRERGAYYVTIEYSLGEVEALMKAYCFVPPGRDAEITLTDSP